MNCIVGSFFLKTFSTGALNLMWGSGDNSGKFKFVFWKTTLRENSSGTLVKRDVSGRDS